LVFVRPSADLSIINGVVRTLQWIPELELLVVASQKGMVALIRILRIDLGDGEEEYVFNREAYLPHAQLRSSPLYGTYIHLYQRQY
jgi:hypothetical protein